MRPLRDVNTILGSLALAGTLALLSPGVQAVRAEDAADPPERSAASDGPTCEAGTVSGREEIVEYLRHVQRLQALRMAASPEAPDAAGDFIPLNNRGYNQGPAEVTFPQATELQRR